jgi:RNase adaptor protein for sRNA GlmZ degradation
MEAKHPKASQNIEQMTQRAKAAFLDERSVRVECYGGPHRSQAVAWKILESMQTLKISEVDLVCLDCEPLPELTPYATLYATL